MTSNPTIKSILETALEREKKGRDFYQKAARTTASEKAKHMFDWLVSVEQTHIQKLSRQLDVLAGTGKFEQMSHPAIKRVESSDLPPAPEKQESRATMISFAGSLPRAAYIRFREYPVSSIKEGSPSYGTR